MCFGAKARRNKHFSSFFDTSASAAYALRPYEKKNRQRKNGPNCAWVGFSTSPCPRNDWWGSMEYPRYLCKMHES